MPGRLVVRGLLGYEVDCVQAHAELPSTVPILAESPWTAFTDASRQGVRFLLSKRRGLPVQSPGMTCLSGRMVRVVISLSWISTSISLPSLRVNTRSNLAKVEN